MHEVAIEPLSLERLTEALSGERAEHVFLSAERARATFGDRTVWHVNATAQGGGVAEMLQVLLAYGNGAGVTNRWLVLDADAEFFAITKRIHNLLHGSPGDGGELGPAEHAHYREVLAANLQPMLEVVTPSDLVVLHDPQTAGLVEGLRHNGLRVVFRSHVGRDDPDEHTDRAWAFLRPYVEGADAFVFTRRVYAPDWIDDDQLVIIPPSIDPYAAKNRELSPGTVSAILATAGLVDGADPDGRIFFERRDGTEGVVRPHTGLLDGPPPPHDARLVVQVSRWDRLKDMPGVMEGFARLAARGGPDDVHLMLVGPDVSGVTDDPEGAEVLAECRARWQALPAELQPRVHLASIPMDDVDENAIIVNALQRHAYAVVQKSLVEGFGLTLTEAMWKAKPVIASAIGGLQDQIADRRDGLLLADPADLDSFAGLLEQLLTDEPLATRLGAAAHARVRSEYLPDRHLDQYVELFAGLAATPAAPRSRREPVPRDAENDYSLEAAERRRTFLREHTGTELHHVGQFSFDPATLPGNIENFTGVAQVPIGIAGPLHIVGEHARGDFYVPLATTEGTLVASYNRGMRLLTECGGVRTTVVDDRMQRAPVFVLDDALAARDFGEWIDAHFADIKTAAESTTRSGRLIAITQHAVGPLRYLRFNYTTGDAAGQNMTGKATLVACEWIREQHPDRPRFILSVSIDTDKKHSQINTLLTRGKRVVAEAVVARQTLNELMGVDTKTLMWARQISQAGNLLAASSNNGAHAANGLAAMFIATGQDVANVAESHAGIVYTQLLDNGDYYWSITLPALIVATFGGGTGLATQRECLELLGCSGAGKVRKFAEICAAVVLAGEISLASAVLHGDWVTSHDRLGRNRA
jgi:NADP-dependent 3-hydroxy-3-methylglutaryl-CoA reductase